MAALGPTTNHEPFRVGEAGLDRVLREGHDVGLVEDSRSAPSVAREASSVAASATVVDEEDSEAFAEVDRNESVDGIERVKGVNVTTVRPTVDVDEGWEGTF